MSGVEVVFWGFGVPWTIFLVFCTVDVPTLVGRWLRGNR